LGLRDNAKLGLGASMELGLGVDSQ